MKHEMSAGMKACIDACEKCHDTCLQTLSQHCLEVGGKHVEPKHVRLMLDCVSICHTCEDFMLRGGIHHADICAACAHICEACAKSCEEVGEMDDCVKACRSCAATCQEMAKTADLSRH